MGAPLSALLLCLVVTTPDGLEAQTGIPQDPRVVVSARGHVYYPITCPAWQRLSPDHRIVFPDSAAAVRAGYRRTTNRRCAEPAGITLPAPERDLPPVGAGRRIAGACVVARVLDGDTVDCEGGARIRLLGIDAPEISQSSFGLRARLALEEMLPPGDTAAVGRFCHGCAPAQPRPCPDGKLTDRLPCIHISCALGV